MPVCMSPFGNNAVHEISSLTRFKPQCSFCAFTHNAFQPWMLFLCPPAKCSFRVLSTQSSYSALERKENLFGALVPKSFSILNWMTVLRSRPGAIRPLGLHYSFPGSWHFRQVYLFISSRSTSRMNVFPSEGFHLAIVPRLRMLIPRLICGRFFRALRTASFVHCA